MKKIIGLLVLAVISFSCEKVIDIPLNEAERKVVIEGNLYDVLAESSIKVSKTGSVYDDSGFDKISGATVVVTDDLGGSFTFEEDANEAGTYIDTLFIAQPNRVYSLSVTTSDGVFTAESSTNSPIAFDSLDFEIQTGGFGQTAGDTNYFVFYNFTDLAEEENYYRAIPVLSSGEESGTYYLSDDKLFNGNTFRQPFFAETIEPGDTLITYLLSMDNAAYTYYTTLGSNQDGGPFSATPANPVSNIEGGAIGHFSAYMTDVEMIIFPE